MANQACYHKLKKYKYQLVDRDYEISIEIEERDVDTDYIALGPDGRLLIKGTTRGMDRAARRSIRGTSCEGHLCMMRCIS